MLAPPDEQSCDQQRHSGQQQRQQRPEIQHGQHLQLRQYQACLQTQEVVGNQTCRVRGTSMPGGREGGGGGGGVAPTTTRDINAGGAPTTHHHGNLCELFFGAYWRCLSMTGWSS